MDSALTRDEWLGHWYLLSTWDGLLDRWPRLVTFEMLSIAEGESKIRFFADNLTPSGRKLRTASIRPPSSQGVLSWQGSRGATRIAPSWSIRMNRPRTLIAGVVNPSLLVRGGGLILARAELGRDAAMAALRASEAELGLLPRMVHAMNFRDLPEGFTPGGSPRLLEFMATAKRSNRTSDQRVAR